MATALFAALVVYTLVVSIVVRHYRSGGVRPTSGGLPVASSRRDVAHSGPTPAPVGQRRANSSGVTGLPPAAWSLPGPTRYDGVAAIGYPHTTLGALGLGYSALAARFTTDPDIAVSVVRATALVPTVTLLQAVAQGTEALRTRFGLAPTGPTPTTIGLSLIACRVASASSTKVIAGYEGTLSVEGGSVAGTTADVSVAIVLAWDGSDWKIDPAADLPTPPIDFPASSATSTGEGWHVCAEG